MYNETRFEREDNVYFHCTVNMYFCPLHTACLSCRYTLWGFWPLPALDINSLQMKSAVGRVTNGKITILHEVTKCIFGKSNVHKTYHLLHKHFPKSAASRYPTWSMKEQHQWHELLAKPTALLGQMLVWTCPAALDLARCLVTGSSGTSGGPLASDLPEPLWWWAYKTHALA